MLEHHMVLHMHWCDAHCMKWICRHQVLLAPFSKDHVVRKCCVSHSVIKLSMGVWPFWGQCLWPFFLNTMWSCKQHNVSQMFDTYQTNIECLWPFLIETVRCCTYNVSRMFEMLEGYLPNIKCL
jgi:hypothetical protein